MQTIYDWVTVAAFAALVVLFLQRSASPDPSDRVWLYLPPAIGCAAANYLGNEGQDFVAIALLLISTAYVFVVLKPLNIPGR